METRKALWNTPPYLLQKCEKNCNLAIFEIANNFIVGIQFLAHRLATKELGTPIAPLKTLKLPLFAPKIVFNYTKKKF